MITIEEVVSLVLRMVDDRKKLEAELKATQAELERLRVTAPHVDPK